MTSFATFPESSDDFSFSSVKRVVVLVEFKDHKNNKFIVTQDKFI